MVFTLFEPVVAITDPRFYKGLQSVNCHKWRIRDVYYWQWFADNIITPFMSDLRQIEASCWRFEIEIPDPAIFGASAEKSEISRTARMCQKHMTNSIRDMLYMLLQYTNMPIICFHASPSLSKRF